jgi:hypothetical protein
MDAVLSSEMFITIYKTARCHNKYHTRVTVFCGILTLFKNMIIIKLFLTTFMQCIYNYIPVPDTHRVVGYVALQL